jgi:hypothetical protein
VAEPAPVPEPPVEEPPEEAAAPEEAAPEIVTEAEEPSGAVEVASRPQVRPARRAAEEEVAAAEPAEAPAPGASAPAEEPASVSADEVADEIAAALAEAADGAGSAAAADPGPPMTQGERDAFRLAVQGCWVVDPGSQAGRVTVTVVFEMTRDGRVAGNVQLLTHNAGSAEAASSAFEAARRAILRCQGDGFPLPAEKYEQWRLVEMTFNPEQMVIR